MKTPHLLGVVSLLLGLLACHSLLAAQVLQESPPGYKCVVLEAWRLGSDGRLDEISDALGGDEFVVDAKTGHVTGSRSYDNGANKRRPDVLVAGSGALIVVTNDGAEPRTLRIDRFVDREEIVFMYHLPFSTVVNGLCMVIE